MFTVFAVAFSLFALPASAATATKISSCTVSVKAQTYTGKSIKPTVTVKKGSVTLKNGIDYTVSYKNNKNIGTASATVKGKGNYTGSVTKSFTIRPKTASLAAASVSDGKVTLTWSKVENADGYTVYYSSGGSYKALKTIVGNGTVSFTSAKLDKGTYSFYVKSYKTVNGKKVYSLKSAAREASVGTASNVTAANLKGTWKISYFSVSGTKMTYDEYAKYLLKKAGYIEGTKNYTTAKAFIIDNDKDISFVFSDDKSGYYKFGNDRDDFTYTVSGNTVTITYKSGKSEYTVSDDGKELRIGPADDMKVCVKQ